MWSKHVDLNTPGDRRSECHARMKPIALAFKNYEVNPFTGRGSGELMIVHQCINCNKISPNRIAGDDNVYQVLSLLENSFNLDTELINIIKNLGINIIISENEQSFSSKKEDALISLLGINYKKYITPTQLQPPGLD